MKLAKTIVKTLPTASQKEKKTIQNTTDQPATKRARKRSQLQ